MAHNEPRSTPLREGMIGIFTGGLYGIAHTLSGHPLDNIKARLQMDKAMHSKSSLEAARMMWCQEGLKAFFRGCLHPLWGSAVYRSMMISGYELCYTFFEQRFDATSFWQQEYCQGLVRPMVVASAILTTLVRVTVEAPIEQAKVMRQTGRAWEWNLLYRGIASQTVRTAAMLTLIFVPYDYAKRKTTLFGSFFGQFAVVTTTCGFAYAAAWPLETIKNLTQAGLPTPRASLAQRLSYVGGPLGLYRGALPGVLCGGLRNGFGFLAMNGLANPLATRIGLRDDAAPR